MRRFPLLAGAAIAAALGAFSLPPAIAGGGVAPPAPAVVRLDPRPFDHRLDGEWTRAGRPIDAPRQTVKIPAPVEIMAYPVSVADYAACVRDAACEAPGGPADRGDLPVTGVSHRDATAYAVWLSQKTGATWRLPTDAEWAQGAGSRFADDALGIADDGTNPAARWLALYETETARTRNRDKTVKPLGTVNVNELGVHDIGGSVWEWTSTCLRRVETDADGTIAAQNEICGIYIVEGQHRAALTFFVRDPKSGGCSVGAPPDNVGFRLVREIRPGLVDRLSRWLAS
ncbi:SUMF1/EgtB/PvdO family nonheme iron enzyme [Pseudochelatococcus sp. B33]